MNKYNDKYCSLSSTGSKYSDETSITMVDADRKNKSW